MVELALDGIEASWLDETEKADLRTLVALTDGPRS